MALWWLHLCNWSLKWSEANRPVLWMKRITLVQVYCCWGYQKGLDHHMIKVVQTVTTISSLSLFHSLMTCWHGSAYFLRKQKNIRQGFATSENYVDKRSNGEWQIVIVPFLNAIIKCCITRGLLYYRNFSGLVSLCGRYSVQGVLDFH